MYSQRTVPANWVYMRTSDINVRPLDTGMKAVSVSCYRGQVLLHIRKYFGESDLKFPTKQGITLTRQEYEHFLSLHHEILADFDRQQFTSVMEKAAAVQLPDICDSNKENTLVIPPIDPQPDDNAVYYLQTQMYQPLNLSQ